MLIQAERAWTGPGRIERGWAMRVEGEHILETGPLRRLLQGRVPGEITVDCGRTVLMPGLVNAHVHLELGWLRDVVPARGGFSAWVRNLRGAQEEARLRLGEDGVEEEIRRACRLGANEMLHHGTTSFLDVSNTGIPAQVLPADGPRGFLALECIGLDPTRVPAIASRARAYIEASGSTRHRRLAVPHALYSCSGDLLQELGGADFHRGVATMHLMESEEEMDLFLGYGKLRDFVDGIFPDHDILFGEDPMDRLRRFYGPPARFVAVHGYAMASSQVQALARMGASLALCPSSRDFFLHPIPPLQDLAKHKVPICIGTDSLASSTSLSLWRQMAILAEEFEELEPGQILSWATLGGAQALGLDAGRLRPGHLADWIAVDAADIPDDELERYLVTEEPPVRVAAVGGDIVLDGRWEGEGE